MVKSHFGIDESGHGHHDRKQEGHSEIARSKTLKFDSAAAEPKDGCKFLSQNEDSSKCLKYFEEWKQCAWDQFKFNEGLTFIERAPSKKSYRFAPNYKYE